MALQAADGYSFPSGHATSALVAFGVLAWLAGTVPAASRPRANGWVGVGWAIALAAAAGVGASRVYLGVHYLSDVLAGFALGAGWLTLVMVATVAVGRAPNGPDPAYPVPGTSTDRTTDRTAGEHPSRLGKEQ